MTRIIQPKHSRVCGQCCVAMVAGLTLAESIKVFGHSKGNTVAGLVRALRKLGVKCGDYLRIIQEETVLPSPCIVQVKFPRRRNYHWVVIHEGALYDPSENGRTDGRLNAYLEVELG